MLVFCFLAFVAFGAVLVLVGANQADMARALDLDLARTGLLASALAGGIGIGVVGAGPLFDRFPTKPLFALSLLVAAAGLVTVSPDMAFSRWILHLTVIGVGAGAYDTLINASVVRRFGEHAPRPMSVVHAAAAVGAIGTPFLADWLASHAHWTASFHWTGGAHALLAILAFAIPFPPNAPPAAARARVRWATIARRTRPLAAIAFAYVGIEAALIVFAEPYAGWLSLDASRGGFAISAAWLGLLLGRIGMLGLRGPLDARVLVVAGATSTALLLAGTLSAWSALEAVFFAIGLSLGCVYPVMIALAGQRVPHAQGSAAGLVAGAGALGGFAIPWIAGALGDRAGVGVALASLAVWSGLIVAAALAAQRPDRVTPEEDA